MNDRKFATTLARGLSVLQAFRAHDSGLSHSELVQRTGLAPATLSRLTYTLCELGFLSQVSGRFRLGSAALALGSVANATLSFMDLVRDDLQAFANQSATLVAIGLRDADRMVLTRTWRPEGVASIWLQPGHRLPVAGSSSGVALLASIDKKRFSTLEPDERMLTLRRLGEHQLLKQGFVIVPEEYRELVDVHAVAVPYLSRDFDEPIIFLCGAMRDELSYERIKQEVGPALRNLVRNLEQQNGSISALSRHEYKQDKSHD